MLEADDLNVDQIHDIVSLFGDAAKRAASAGFDGVQIHAAHGFYLSRFLSPVYNHRQDAYSGRNRNRATILTDILADIRVKAPGLHVTMKINCSDFVPGGVKPNDALETILVTAQAGLDSVEISGNGTSVAGVRAGVDEGYFLPFAKVLKQVCDIPVILVGGCRSVEKMNEAVEGDNIDLISLSRSLIRETELIQRWEEGNLAPSKCVSCNGCCRSPGHKCVFVKSGKGKEL